MTDQDDSILAWESVLSVLPKNSEVNDIQVFYIAVFAVQSIPNQ